MEFSVHRLAPPNTYSYVQEENVGSTRKSVKNYLLFMCITNLILAIHTQSMNGLEEPFEDSGKKFLQPTRSGCMAFVINDSYNIISRRISDVGISFAHTHTHTHRERDTQTHIQFNVFPSPNIV